MTVAKSNDEIEDKVRWGRTRQMRDFRGDVIRTYKKHNGNDIIEQPGSYFGTIEVQFLCETAGGYFPSNFTLTVPPGGPLIDQAFNLAIGDESLSWFGGPHVLTEADTNLQNPGKNLWANEVFIIEAVSARTRGMRIQFSATDIASMSAAIGLPNTTAMVNGQQFVRDENGLVLPAELFNQYDDSFRLVKTLEEVATLHFTWKDNLTGGSKDTYDKYIESFLHVTESESDVKRTSGGGNILDLPSGFLWCLDEQFQPNSEQGGNGLFDAEIHINESVNAPFQPIPVFGSPGPVAPTGIALYWEIRVFGTGLLPGDQNAREQRVQQTRRKVA